MAKPASRPADTTPTSAPPESRPGPVMRAAAGPVTWADDRLGLAALGRKNLRKVFPDHWSFLLGEIALYSFIILILTGIFLTLWFKPSMAEIDYQGSYQLLKGTPMSEAFASTLDLSFDVRGGLLMRQMHHWAANLFVAAMIAHMLRNFFTGSFRKPRELNWLLGVGLLAIGLIEGFAGYSLPDDLLSGTGLRFVDGLIRSIPLVGTWLEFFVFGGEFPGSVLIPRLYMLHILLIPGIILGLISAHLALVVYHKHTQFPGPGRTENNVVGAPLFPVYMAKAGGFFFIVFGIITLMGTFLRINAVWTYGPYTPNMITAGSQPDWYMGFVEGAIRIMPNWEWHVGGTTWSWNIFLPGVGLMGLLFTALAVYPFIEQWVTGDKGEHHILDRPRNVANRTAIGVAAMTCYGLFWIGGGNDIVADIFHLSLEDITRVLRVAVFVGPVIAFLITKRICIGLQRDDLHRLEHGSESGIIRRSPQGEYSEADVPISQGEAYVLTQHVAHRPISGEVEVDENGVPRQEGKPSRFRALMSRWYFSHDLPKPTAEELAEGHDGDVAERDGADEEHEDASDEDRPALTGH